MKIDHIQLAIPENSEPLCRRFWTEILGFEELEKPENLRGRGGAWFRHGSVEIHLGVEKNFRSAKKAHPAFAVAQITLLADSLKANDHAVLWDTSIPGRRRFFTTDPVGNRIKFMKIPHKA
ncbi:VOC family protein [Rhodobacteraceae bacterium nBUS_24]